MKRLIDMKLKNWALNHRRKPLILRGARQVGKTYSVKMFGKEHFQGNIVVIDLEKRSELRKIFDKDINISEILKQCELEAKTKIIPGKTLLFLDEIQTTPRAIMALRYFYEEIPHLHVIAAGSLLEFAVEFFSFPVGRVQFLNMYPLNFYEFLLACGSDILAEDLNKNKKEDMSDFSHNLFRNSLRNYFFVGGMPEAVLAFSESELKSFQEVFEVHKELIFSMREDFSKYSPRVNPECLNNVLNSISQNVGRQIIYSKLAEGFSNNTIKTALNCLEKAQIIQKIHHTSAQGLPLSASQSAKKFKAIMLDIGIMQSLCGNMTEKEYVKENLLDVYRGALAEQFVGQELRFIQENELYYWSRQARNSSAEIDYVFSANGKVYPIEVKSGTSGKLKSMKSFLDNHKNVDKGYVFRDDIFLKEKNMEFFPIYKIASILDSL